MVDTVEVAIIPILLGGGLPLLPHPASSAKLRLIEHTIYEKTGTVEYSAIYCTNGRPFSYCSARRLTSCDISI